MSRSFLINLLHRAYQQAQGATPPTRSPAASEERLNPSLSRRRVLQSSAAAVGWLGLNSLTPWGQVAEAVPTESRVLIVGAGVAGLTAAYRLRQAGVPVDVVEATQRVGGRLVSVTDLPDAPGTVELGGEFIDSRHFAVKAIAQELGLAIADLQQADQGLENELLYFQGTKYSHAQVAEAFRPLAQRISQDLQTLSRVDLTYKTSSPAAERLDRLSLEEYLADASVDPVIRQLVQVAYVTEYGLDAAEQTCLNMLFLIGRDVGQWSTYGTSDERWHVIGGNEQIPRRLAASVHTAIETGTVLESIRAQLDGRYRVSLRQGSTSQEQLYERVLLTVPFTVLRQVDLAVDLPPLKRQAIQELGYGTCSKLATPYQERIWRTRYNSTVYIYTDLDFQNTWESARYGAGPQGWVTDLRGGRQGVALGQGQPDDHAERLAMDLEALFPGISQVRRGRSLRAHWVAEPYAQGSYSCYRPGQWTQFCGVEGERVGNLWFAGEHCSVESQGFMNGACETAELAVLSILQDMGLHAGVAQQRQRLLAHRPQSALA